MTISVDLLENTLHINNDEIYMEPKKAEILYFLIKHINKSLTREYIIDNIWGINSNLPYNSNVLNCHICNIRKIIKPYNYYIKNRHYTGFKLTEHNPTIYTMGLLA